jgi:hypothetical protein
LCVVQVAVLPASEQALVVLSLESYPHPLTLLVGGWRLGGGWAGDRAGDWQLVVGRRRPLSQGMGLLAAGRALAAHAPHVPASTRVCMSARVCVCVCGSPDMP